MSKREWKLFVEDIVEYTELIQQYIEDWIGIVGLRNRIAHEYFGIGIEIVWNIVKQELPKLKKPMKQILEGE